MKILVLFSHPKFNESIIHKKWLDILSEYPEIHVRNLSEIYPEGVIDVQLEQQTLLDYDRIVFQYPFRWYNIPPILRVWQDEVLTYNWAYGSKGIALKGKEYMVAISTGGPKESYQAGGYNHYSISELLKPMQQTANLIKMKYLPPYVFHGAVSSSDAEIEISGKKLVEHLKRLYE